MGAKLLRTQGNTQEDSPNVFRHKNRPPAIQVRIGKIKPGTHTKLAFQQQQRAHA